ncbi:MAG: terminase gpA endonuclease subunit [Chthoniobacteraceae bacterium]
MFSPWLRSLAAKAFAPIPDEPAWMWADREVRFRKQHSAEPCYRSAKTPWVRWLHEIMQAPWRMRKGRRVRIRRVRIKKCTQSGFTEAILNGFRRAAKFDPKNFIYAINSKDEAVNVRERLVDTLEALGEHVFKPGEDADELTKLTLRLREMTGWFIGSFSEGAFANKPAPWVVADEYDDHATFTNNATTLDLLEERVKKFDDESLSIALGKPQLVGGPIDKEHAKGDQFEWMVPCPHCGCCQLLEWERVRFGHCKDLFGKWDRERVLAETFYECLSGCHITEDRKEWMEAQGRWYLTALGDPETVSLHMSDLHALDKGSTLGHLALEFIDAAAAAKKGDFTKLQVFNNGRLGLGFEQRVEKFGLIDVMNCRAAYRRGTIPQAGLILCDGMDVGLYVNTKWVAIAMHPQTAEGWIIDWNVAGQPSDLLTIIREKSYRCPTDGSALAARFAFIDVRYKTDKVYAVAQQMPGRIFPMMGLPAQTIARGISWDTVPGMPADFGVIKFKKEGANDDLLLDRIKGRRPPLIHFPEDADEEFMLEFTHERLIKDPVTARLSWAPKPNGPNHWQDATEMVLTGFDFLIDGPRTRASLPIAAAPAPAEV